MLPVRDASSLVKTAMSSSLRLKILSVTVERLTLAYAVDL